MGNALCLYGTIKAQRLYGAGIYGNSPKRYMNMPGMQRRNGPIDGSRFPWDPGTGLREQEKGGINMDCSTGRLILHAVTEDDLPEVARTWPSDHRPISEEEAKGVISYIRDNYARNTAGCIYHLILAVCGMEDSRTFMGWCGLDGRRRHTEPEIFILLNAMCERAAEDGAG